MRLSKLTLFVLLAAFAFSCVPATNDLTSNVTEEGIQISEGDKKVLFYQVKPKSLDGKYERSHYVHPLYSLEGSEITEDFPEDHPHHHGIFSAWHQIVYKNKPIADSWMSRNVSWEIVDTNVKKENETMTIESEVVWKSVLEGDQPEPIVKETSKITVHPATDQYRIIDFNFSLSALTDSLKIGGSSDEKGYGGFSLRFKLPENITFVSADKEVKAQNLGIEAGPWMDFRGSFEGDGQPASGVAVFSHPSNPGNPQPWILRQQKSMQNLAFPGRTPLALTIEGWDFQYRLVIHDNELQEGDIEKMYQEYAKP